MGACKLSCESVFNKDGDLYCRQDRCDLHFTTDILTNPEHECLAKKCSTPPTYANGALVWPASRDVRCCTSDFDAEELSKLCVTATHQVNTNNPQSLTATTPFLSAAPWKSTDYTSSWATCPKIMSHKSFLDLAVLHKTKIVTELLDDDHPIAGLSSKADVANRLVEDYTNSAHSISPSDVMLQSSNVEHVTTWLTSTFNQAVLHIKAGDRKSVV